MRSLLQAPDMDCNGQVGGGSTTPLIVAAREGHLGTIRILLGAGARVDLAKADGCTPLFIAAQEGELDVVRCLLQHHAAVD